MQTYCAQLEHLVNGSQTHTHTKGEVNGMRTLPTPVFAYRIYKHIRKEYLYANCWSDCSDMIKHIYMNV